MIDPESTRPRNDLRRWMTEEREAFLRSKLAAWGVKAAPSACGLRCADFIDQWVGGFHHFPGGGRAIRRTAWDDFFVEINYDDGLATFDCARITHLVFLAHDLAIRADVTPCNMRYMKLLLHPRDGLEGGMSERHPTMEMALADWRERHPLTERP